MLQFRLVFRSADRMKDDYRTRCRLPKSERFYGRYARDGHVDRLRGLRFNDLAQGPTRQRIYEADNMFLPRYGEGQQQHGGCET
jgi:hypothetical protein